MSEELEERLAAVEKALILQHELNEKINTALAIVVETQRINVQNLNSLIISKK